MISKLILIGVAAAFSALLPPVADAAPATDERAARSEEARSVQPRIHAQEKSGAPVKAPEKEPTKE